MPQRSVCRMDNTLIGIESVYTVIDGKQINIPQKLKELRTYSQENRLFCPCGCGARLTLVAGDRNLKEQHFRLKDRNFEKECQVILESQTSMDSKIVLKCWLDDMLGTQDLQMRVPACDIYDSSRKYEYSFVSMEKRLAVSYCYDRVNLSEEKFDILESNGLNIGILYITDRQNGGCNGQYPEAMMRMQERQGYCLLLAISGIDYDKAWLKSVFYTQDQFGVWAEKLICKGHIGEYTIDRHGNLLFQGTSITEHLNHVQSRALEKPQFKEEYVPKDLDVPMRDQQGNRLIECEFCGKVGTEELFVSYGGIHRVNLGECKECARGRI